MEERQADVGATRVGGRQRTSLRVTGVSKSYPGTRALDRVGLQIPTGTVHAIAGGNGSGKSTLIKLLAGVVKGDPGGTIEFAGSSLPCDQITPSWAHRNGLRFVHQDLGLHSSLSVAENLFVGRDYPKRAGAISWRSVHRTARGILDRHQLDVPTTARCDTLGPAEQTIVAIARALDNVDESAATLLVLDEPTARLPAAEVARLLTAMRRLAHAGHGVVFVSHHLDEVLDTADAVTVLRDGRHLSTCPIGEINATELTRLIAGRDDVGGEAAFDRPPSGEPIARITNLSGGRVHGINLVAHAGEVIGLAGLTGSGRTDVLELTFGTLKRTSGSVTIDGHTLSGSSIDVAMRRGIAYVPAERTTQAGFMDLSVVENLSAATIREHRGPLGLRHRRERRHGMDAMDRFGIKAPSASAPLRSLSGGNQQKVILARWCALKPRLLLLDEPTQGVDVGARDEIQQLIARIAAAGASVLLVSSDTDELLRLAHRILVLEDGRVTDTRLRADASRQWLDEHFYRTNRHAKEPHDTVNA